MNFRGIMRSSPALTGPKESTRTAARTARKNRLMCIEPLAFAALRCKNGGKSGGVEGPLLFFSSKRYPGSFDRKKRSGP
jgi:hypothetical protein